MSTFPPAMGMSSVHTEDVIRLAGMAPSLHNTQPWRFHITPDRIELHYDPRARLRVADPEDRELFLGCGASLLNLRLALIREGIRPQVTEPRLSGPTALAEVRAGGKASPSPEETELCEAIPRRRSNRKPYLSTPVPTRHRHALIAAARAEGCWLHVVSRAQLGRLEGLVHRAHRAQIADPRFKAELAQWTGRTADTGEGVPAQSAGPQREPQDQWVLRDFSGGAAEKRAPGQEFESDPLLVALCTNGTERSSALEAGQALQRLLLTATIKGLSASLISQVVEVPETRDELQELLGEGLRPHALIRLGYGQETPATPRREPASLLV